MAFYEFGPGRQREVAESTNTVDVDVLHTGVDPLPVAEVRVTDGAAIPTGRAMLVADGAAADLAASVFGLGAAGKLADVTIAGLASSGVGRVSLWAADGLVIVAAPHNAGAVVEEFGGTVAEAVAEACKPSCVVTLSTMDDLPSATMRLHAVPSSAASATPPAPLPAPLPSHCAIRGAAGAFLAEAEMRGTAACALVGRGPSREPHTALPLMVAALLGWEESPGALEPAVRALAPVLRGAESAARVRSAASKVASRVGAHWAGVLYT